jgi:hypothetical protein
VNKKSTSKAKTKPSTPTTKAARPKRRVQSLEDVVGQNVYQTWVDMLHVLVPDGRTHRLAPLVAAMLQYALAVAENKRNDEEDQDSVAASLLDTSDVSDASEVKTLVHLVVTKLFKDAQVGFQRTSSRGVSYSIADDAYEEFLHWDLMPWE